MTLAKRSCLFMCSFLIWGGCWTCWFAPGASYGEPLQGAGRRYGPTTFHEYYVRVDPAIITMSHAQHPRVTVTVENAFRQPVDDVPVRFTPSEGRFITEANRTRRGMVTGTFMAATGSDSPRTAFLVVTVEDLEVTLFIHIVPAVFGR